MMPEISNTQASPEAETLPPMQLRMSISARRVRALPEAAKPRGYVLRAFRPGDEDAWLQLLGLSGFTMWDRKRIEAYLADDERLKGSRVVARGSTIAAATFASHATLEQDVGVLDYVASHPQHARKGLARAVCTSVLKFQVGRGYPAVTLSTDDWRIPAISLYLSLGFEPVMERQDMPSRWEAVIRHIHTKR